MKEKQKTHIAILISLIFACGVSALLGKDDDKSSGMGNVIKDGVIGAATGDVGGSIAIGAGVRGIKRRRARKRQAEVERAETERMRARQPQRTAEQNARASYETKLREQNQRQQHVDFRKPDQRQQIRAISGDK